MSRPDFLSDHEIELIVQALHNAYESNRISYDEEIGNTPTSFGVAVWQSSLFFLEREFGSVIDAKVHRSGSNFWIELPSCRLYFYKFGSRMVDSAEEFRLDGERSQTRSRIVEHNQQMSLFGYTMDSDAQPVNVPELIVVHSGNPRQGLLQVHVGAPISSQRDEDGWLWIEQVYEKDLSETAQPPARPTTPSFSELEVPEIDVEVRFDEMGEPNVDVQASDPLADDQEHPEADGQ